MLFEFRSKPINRSQSRSSIISSVFLDSKPVVSAPFEEYEGKESQERNSIEVKTKKVGNLHSKLSIIPGFRELKHVIFKTSTKLGTKEKTRNLIEDIVRKADISPDVKREKKDKVLDWFNTFYQGEFEFFSWLAWYGTYRRVEEGLRARLLVARG